MRSFRQYFLWLFLLPLSLHALTFEQQIDSVMSEAIAAGVIPGGVVCAVSSDSMLFLHAYGNRCVWPDTLPMTDDAVFDLASLSKPVGTAMSVFNLVADGSIGLNDPVFRYLPAFADSTCTVMHLLTHTSGLPAYMNIARLRAAGVPETPEAFIDTICRTKRLAPAGTAYRYSCLNYITLQAVLQTVTGKTLADYAADNVFRPLRMSSTAYRPFSLPADSALRLSSPSSSRLSSSRLSSSLPASSLPASSLPADSLLVPTEICLLPTHATSDAVIPAASDAVIPAVSDAVTPATHIYDSLLLCGMVHDPLARIMMHGNSGNAGVFSTARDLASLARFLLTYKDAPLIRTMTTLPDSLAFACRTPGWDKKSPEGSWCGTLMSPYTYCHTGYTGTSMAVDPFNDFAVILLTNRVHPCDPATLRSTKSPKSSKSSRSPKSPKSPTSTTSTNSPKSPTSTNSPKSPTSTNSPKSPNSPKSSKSSNSTSAPAPTIKSTRAAIADILFRHFRP